MLDSVITSPLYLTHAAPARVRLSSKRAALLLRSRRRRRGRAQILILGLRRRFRLGRRRWLGGPRFWRRRSVRRGGWLGLDGDRFALLDRPQPRHVLVVLVQ